MCELAAQKELNLTKKLYLLIFILQKNKTIFYTYSIFTNKQQYLSYRQTTYLFSSFLKLSHKDMIFIVL